MGNDKKDMTATVKPLRVMSWLDNDESAALLSTALLILGKVGYEDACSSRNKKKEARQTFKLSRMSITNDFLIRWLLLS